MVIFSPSVFYLLGRSGIISAVWFSIYLAYWTSWVDITLGFFQPYSHCLPFSFLIFSAVWLLFIWLSTFGLMDPPLGE